MGVGFEHGNFALNPLPELGSHPPLPIGNGTHKFYIYSPTLCYYVPANIFFFCLFRSIFFCELCFNI